MRLPRRLEHGQEAELVGHLEELRSRIFVAGGAILAGSTIAFIFHARLLRVLLDSLPPNHRHLLTLGVAEPFTTSLKVSVAAGFALALPIVLWQVWAFFAPALNPRTQRSIAGFVVFAGGLMFAGMAFGDRVALPAALKFLTNYDNSIYDVQIRASDYISFAVLVLAACGAVFELPIVVLGIVAVIGVALPGVDPVTTIVETIPLAILFEASVWMSVVFERRWAAAAIPVEAGA
jgi:sec-independent protein translocase protein TatC